MRIFVDTSAFYALLDRDDRNYSLAIAFALPNCLTDRSTLNWSLTSGKEPS